MAALTGTQILALARLYAQDNGDVYGVSDAEGLIILNDVYLALRDEQDTPNEAVLAATTSGLTFAAGDTVKVTTSTNLEAIISAHPSDTTGIPSTNLLTRPLDRRTVHEVLELHNDGGDGVVSQGSTEWECWAAEKVDGGPPGQWRVHVYPALNRTRYLHTRVNTFQTLSALSETPDLTEREGRDMARIMALVFCPLLNRDEKFVSDLLKWVKPEHLDRVGGAAGFRSKMPSRVAERLA